MGGARRSRQAPEADPGVLTEEHRQGGARPRITVRRFRLSIVEGTAPGDWSSSADRCSIGSHPSNDLRLEKGTVSRFHCEVQIGSDGALLRDLGSRNGTLLDGVYIQSAFLRNGSLIRVGQVTLRFELGSESNPMPVSDRAAFGALVGASAPMRTTFALLERVAASDVTVLLEGETGTGKGAAAESIHRESARRNAPFAVVDCSAISASLLESELFGHEKGAFTGADTRRSGAFEEADGGTLFLDEVGELPADIQPKLLRALEERMIRRVGSNTYKRVDLRVIAATNRDLRAEVNDKRFRADLYFRLAVARITMPPLRERPEDIPLVVETILKGLGGPKEAADPLRTPEFMDQLRRGAWPGNVRELRNYIERCLVFRITRPFEEAGPVNAAPAVDLRVPFVEARRQATEDFERRYLAELVAAHGDKTVQAATAAGLDRVYLYRLLRRHGLR